MAKIPIKGNGLPISVQLATRGSVYNFCCWQSVSLLINPVTSFHNDLKICAGYKICISPPIHKKSIPLTTGKCSIFFFKLCILWIEYQTNVRPRNKKMSLKKLWRLSDEKKTKKFYFWKAIKVFYKSFFLCRKKNHILREINFKLIENKLNI